MSMTPDQIDAFLDLRLVGALGTLRADGSPWVVPIWYRWDGSTIKVWSSPTMGWVKRLQDEPRVAFTAFEHEAPRRAVYLRGTATVAEGTMQELREDIRAVTARYVDADKVRRRVAGLRWRQPEGRRYDRADLHQRRVQLSSGIRRWTAMRPPGACQSSQPNGVTTPHPTKGSAARQRAQLFAASMPAVAPLRSAGEGLGVRSVS